MSHIWESHCTHLKEPLIIGCRSFPANEPLIIGLFCGKWTIKIRHPMILRHPVSNKVISHIQESHCTHLKKSDARKRALQKRLYSAKETYHFQEPTNCSHPISHIWRAQIQIATTLVPCRTSERWVTHVTTRDSRGRSDSKHLELQICQFSRHFFEWRGLRLLTWKPAWNFGDSRENVFDMYANSRENLLEVLAVVIIWSQMSSDCGHTSEECGSLEI